jgi:HD-like signal output (HDOD) protein
MTVWFPLEPAPAEGGCVDKGFRPSHGDGCSMPMLSAASDPDRLIKSALAKVGEIVTLPEVTVRIISLVDDPKSTARDLHRVIMNDPALSTRVLKVVNSAFYGLPGQVSQLDRAIVLLGLSAIKNIAITASIARLFGGHRISEEFTARDVWKHSLAVAVATRQFSSLMGRRKQAEEAFLAGLIHDLGLLVERQAFPEQLAEVVRRAAADNRAFCDIETEVIGIDHQALGAALAVRWKFPRTLQVVLGYHHRIDNLKPEDSLLPTLVYIADVLCCHEQIGFHLTARCQPLEDTLLASVGLAESHFNQVRDELHEQTALAESILSG